MFQSCTNCGQTNTFKVYSFEPDNFIQLAITFRFLPGSFISYHEVISFLNIKKIANSYICSVCKHINTICPYCFYCNIKVNFKHPKCDKCNKNFYLY